MLGSSSSEFLSYIRRYSVASCEALLKIIKILNDHFAEEFNLQLDIIEGERKKALSKMESHFPNDPETVSKINLFYNGEIKNNQQEYSDLLKNHTTELTEKYLPVCGKDLIRSVEKNVLDILERCVLLSVENMSGCSGLIKDFIDSQE